MMILVKGIAPEELWHYKKPNRIALSKHRIEVAKERLRSARLLVDNGDYKAAANRSYYAAFSGMRAVSAPDGLVFKKHSGVIAESAPNE